MAANNNIQISDLDFDSIKSNLKTFLKGQTAFQDYNFEGSALSNLIDILAYNTHYNAYYLNMVASEMFLDTAQLRSSVVSHAKLLGYTPKSAISPSATISLEFTGVVDSTVTIPAYTKFQSESVDGVNYTFVTADQYVENVSAGVATFANISIHQGEPISYNYVMAADTNPSATFKIPDAMVDTSTLLVSVQKSSIDTTTTIFNKATNYLILDPNSPVYFLQEALDGTYEIYFGDGVLGQSLVDGNIVTLNYLVTSGTTAHGANNFTLMDSIQSIANHTLSPITPASNGQAQESVDSVKYTAPKSYSAQNRAVSKEDYISIIQANDIGVTFDSVNVWGGEDNIPPAFGQVFISLKPTGAYSLTQTQKNRLVESVIKPASVMTVQPTILEPDYTFIKVTANVLFDPKKTKLTASQIQSKIKLAIQSFSDATLNTFNSTFSNSELITAVQNVDKSIVANECLVQIQKKIYPVLGAPSTYSLVYDVPLNRGVFTAGINSLPSFQYYRKDNNYTLINDVYIEEVPFPTSGIDTIKIANPGFNYKSTPIVSIAGDGTGATASATIVDGYIKTITVTNSGNNYTQAIVTIVNAPGDTTGTNGAVIAQLKGQYGSLRSYYFDSNNIKAILDANIGTIDYYNGVITLNSFAPTDVNDPYGQLTFTANPKSTIISSSKNRIISIDPFDPVAIVVNMTAK